MDWSALETRLIRIGDGSIECEGQHTRARLICQGNGDLEAPAGPTCIPAAQWVIATTGRKDGASSGNTTSLLVSFDAAWPNGESLFKETANRSFSAEPYPQMEAAAVALLCYVRKYLPDTETTLPHSITDFHTYTGLKNRLDAWLEAFVSAMTAEGAVPSRLGITDQRVQRAVRLIDSWSLELPLDRERLAREAGLTVTHLERLFMAQLHVTPSRYFDRRRIDRACLSLCGSEMSIKAIAFGMGFHSEAHFSHWFKQHQQTCPRSFRQAHLGTAWEGSQAAGRM